MAARFGFHTDLSVTKIAEAGFGRGVAIVLANQYPEAQRRIFSACQAGRALWKFNQPLVFLSETFGLIAVEEGYITDFSSVPRTPIAFWLAGDTAHASAGVHDKLCSDYYPDLISWRAAADVFREAMRHEGVPAWRRAIMYWGVRQADPANTWEDPS